MIQFYVSTEEDAKRCQESQLSRIEITISGINENGSVQAFSGVVQSVDEDKQRPTERRWRITILD